MGGHGLWDRFINLPSLIEAERGDGACLCRVCPVIHQKDQVWSSADVPASLASSPRSHTAFPLSLPCVPLKLITFLFVMDLIMQLYKCHLILLLFNSIERKEERRAPNSTVVCNFISDRCPVRRSVFLRCVRASVCVSGSERVWARLCVYVCMRIFVPALTCMPVCAVAVGAPNSLP